MISGFDLSIDIKEYEFSKSSLLRISNNKWVKDQWPIVYFIENVEKRIAYIGESTNGFSRINTHLGNDKRNIFNKISIIGSDKFNKSVTLEIESRLIQYISAEDAFSLQNGNNGLTRHTYYQQELYAPLIKQVWQKLLEKKIVNKTLEEIQNSNLFKYSPYKALNQDQLNSVLEILRSLNKHQGSPIFIKGSAGTGKTILATYLIKLLTSNPEELNSQDLSKEGLLEVELVKQIKNKHPAPLKIALVVAMSSLRETLQNVFENIPGLNKNMVISPSDTFKKDYDILIVDEAHRLRQRRNISWMGVFTKNNTRLKLDNTGTELDWIRANSKYQIFFYDKEQSIKPSDVPEDRFSKLLSEPTTLQLELKSQMRVKAGVDYIDFVNDLLNCRTDKISRNTFPEEYEFLIFDSLKELYEELTMKETQYKLCRLVAGYSWPWETGKENPSKNYDIEIDGLTFCWNRTDKDWIGSKTSFSEIGCIHTTQGSDLNYVGVIFGNEITYNPVLKQIEINRDEYYDRNGQAGITDINELKAFIVNIYKTTLYRGIRGAFIYACDTELRDYLKQYVPVYKNPSFAKILSIQDTKINENYVPLYDITAAAGSFSELQLESGTKWIEIAEKYKPKKQYFAIKVKGESMNKKIPNGSICLFKKYSSDSRNGEIVLVRHPDIYDKEMGAYTVKYYESKKSITNEVWKHESIILKPFSNSAEYKNIELDSEQAEELNTIGVFVAVL